MNDQGHQEQAGPRWAEVLRADVIGLAALPGGGPGRACRRADDPRRAGAAVTTRSAFRHLGFAFADGAGTLLKPLAWLGDMSFGPPRDGRATFQRLDRNPRRAGVPDLDEAGMRAGEAYFRAYGPATPEHLQYWLGEGPGAGRKRIRSWIAEFGGRLVAIDIDGGTRPRPVQGYGGTGRDARHDRRATPAGVRPMGSAVRRTS